MMIHASGLDKRYLAAGLAVLRDEGVILDRRRQETRSRGEKGQQPHPDGEGDRGKGGAGRGKKQ